MVAKVITMIYFLPEYRSAGDDYWYTYKTTVKWEPQRITKGIEVTGP